MATVEAGSRMCRTLYLIPATIGETDTADVLPQGTLKVIYTLEHFAVEDERTARRFLIKAGYKTPVSQAHFYVLNEHTDWSDIPEIFRLSGKADIGVISEAGVPAVADPGASLVMEAHRQGIRVVPLTGPSSILLAVMASGLNGQNFAFNGYLPVKDNDRDKMIRFYEKRSSQENQAQVFIEAPYRNNRLLRSLVDILNPETMLCIAVNITTEEESVITRKVSFWKSGLPDINKKPAVFIFQLLS